MSAAPHPLVPAARGALLRHAARAIAPRKPLSVSQWSDTRRILSGKGSGEPGRYKSSRTPHLCEIMDCLSAHSPVQRVTVMKPAQGGVTELALNWIGYTIDESPAPMLAVLPTLEVRKRWVRQRLNPMLEDTPELADVFDARRTRDGGNSEDLKDFPGGMLIIGGANSPASLSSMPIARVVCDELDRFPWEVGQEGDPLGLIEERTKAFMRRKVLLISTPTVAGHSRIAQEYAASDQRELHLPCPHCGDYIVLRWQHEDDSLGLEESKTTGRVWYICRACGAGIEEHDKTAMLQAHRWVPRHPERRARGYHWTGLCSPVGLGYTWREMLDQWRTAQDDTSKLKRFWNTAVGLTFEEKSDGLEGALVQARCEVYPEPLPAGLRAAGVDIQKDRIELTIYDFAAHHAANGKPQAEEAWAHDHLVLPGDTLDQAVWDALDDALDDAGVQIAGIDGSYQTQMVNAFVATRPWCAVLKGMAGEGRPLVEDERKRRHRLRQRNRRGVPQEPIGVDFGKALLYARLRNTGQGPGRIHFPENHPAFDEEFFAQLTAEKMVTKARGGRPFTEWVKSRPRNEALDCALYAIVAYHLRTVFPMRPPLTAEAGRAPPPPAAPSPAQEKGPAHDFEPEGWSDRL